METRGFRVYVDSIQYDVGLDTFYTLSGLTLGQEYDVSVTCFDNSGEESWSSEHMVVSPLSVPIIFAPAYISFGYVFIGGSFEFPLAISNNGTDTLNISDIYTLSTINPSWLTESGQITDNANRYLKKLLNNKTIFNGVGIGTGITTVPLELTKQYLNEFDNLIISLQG